MKPTLISLLEARWFNTGQTFAGEHIYKHPVMTDKLVLYNPDFDYALRLDVHENCMQEKDLVESVDSPTFLIKEKGLRKIR